MSSCIRLRRSHHASKPRITFRTSLHWHRPSSSLTMATPSLSWRPRPSQQSGAIRKTTTSSSLRTAPSSRTSTKRTHHRLKSLNSTEVSHLPPRARLAAQVQRERLGAHAMLRDLFAHDAAHRGIFQAAKDGARRTSPFRLAARERLCPGRCEPGGQELTLPAPLSRTVFGEPSGAHPTLSLTGHHLTARDHYRLAE